MFVDDVLEPHELDIVREVVGRIKAFNCALLHGPGAAAALALGSGLQKPRNGFKNVCRNFDGVRPRS